MPAHKSVERAENWIPTAEFRAAGPHLLGHAGRALLGTFAQGFADSLIEGGVAA